MTKEKTSGIRKTFKGKAAAHLFVVDVPTRGYEWRADMRTLPLPGTRPERGPWLVERSPYGQVRRVRQVAPLAESGLHRGLAALDGAERDKIKAFANRYGFLGAARTIVPDAGGPQPGFPGEALSFWRKETRELARLLALLDLLTGKDNQGVPDDAALAELVCWDAGGVSLRWPLLPGEPFASEEIIASRSAPAVHPEALDLWPPGELQGPARFALLREVNRKLRGRTSAQIDPYGERGLALMPHNLLAAAYLLLATELGAGTHGPRRCEPCGRYFFPRRADNEYCSPACRQKAYEARKRGTTEGDE